MPEPDSSGFRPSGSTPLEAGAHEPSPYMTRLSDAIAEARGDYTLSAVVAIAELRTDLAAPTLG